MPPNFLLPDRKNKIEKNFIVNDNNKIIRTWYLSSKLPVLRFIVHQTIGGTGGTKLSIWLKTNVFKYCALFCNNVVKIQLQ